MANFYLAICVVGVVVPYGFFLPWLLDHGLDISLFIRELVSTRVGAFFGADVIVSAVALIGFVFTDGRRAGMKWLWARWSGPCASGSRSDCRSFFISGSAPAPEHDEGPRARVRVRFRVPPEFFLGSCPTNGRQPREGVPPYRIGAPIAPASADAFLTECVRAPGVGGTALMERRDPASLGRSQGTGAGHHLPQLAVLVPPTVVPGAGRLPPIAPALTRDAKAYAGQRLSPPLRDPGAAFLTLEQALAARQAAARTLDGILDARVNLILHGPVPGPAAGHVSPPSRGFETSPDHDTPGASPLRQIIEPQS